MSITAEQNSGTELKLFRELPDFYAVIKPRGMASEGELPAALLRLLRESGRDAAEPYVVHRLDRPTAGLMILAKNKRAAAEISEIIKNGGFHKTYTAFAVKNPALGDSGEMRDYLFFDRRRDKSFIADPRKPSAKSAVLTYSLYDSFTFDNIESAAYHVYPETGRSHQIRIQFASRGAPLIGDGKYGSRQKAHCAALISTGIRFGDVELSLPDPAFGEY